MLTVDSEELNGNYSGFTDRKIRLIKETFVLFQHFSYCDSNDVPKENQKLVKLDGTMFGNPNYIYYVNKNLGRGLHIQVFKKCVDGGESMLFGCYIFDENDKLSYTAYHQSMALDIDDEI